MKILIIGPAWVGDMMMAQSLFRELKQDKPDCIIDVLAPRWSEPLLERMPEVHRSMPLDLKHGELNLRKRREIGVSLRAEQYDQAYILPNSLKSALIPWWAKIPVRTGWRGEWRYGLLNDIRILNKATLPLLIQRYAQLAKSKNAEPIKTCLYPKLSVESHSVNETRQKFDIQINNKVIAFCPGAEYGPAKQWPAKHFAALADKLHDEGFTIWLFGSAKDNEIAAEINQLADVNCTDLTGKTSLGEAIDLLSLVDSVITNDSGLMHVSCALGKKVVALYGSSSPAYTPPLSKSAKIISLNLSCSPCFARVCPLGHTNCLNNLMPEQVQQALGELVHESSHR